MHEVWFDGANGEGPNGKKQVYDWDAILKTIHRLQPKAVTAIMGDDVRWVGNERGIGRETEWSATVLTPGSYARSDRQNKELGISGTGRDLGSRDLVARAGEMFWYPSEVDVSIRPGWFYHADQDSQVKSLPHLADIYFKSVGYNSVLLLNIPPDTRGLIHENDVKRIKELSDYLKSTFARNYVRKGCRMAGCFGCGPPVRCTEGSPCEYFHDTGRHLEGTAGGKFPCRSLQRRCMASFGRRDNGRL